MDSMKWELRMSNQGNPDVSMLTLNGLLVPASKVEIVHNAKDGYPSLVITLPMVAGLGNDVVVITDTTPFKEQIIEVTSKKE